MTDTNISVARLQSSRQRLREVMHKQSAPRPVTDLHGGRGSVLAWLDTLKRQPAAGLVLDTLGNWWGQHPLRVIGMVVGEGARAMARPISQRHPLALVAMALVFGALFVWTRPWRWILKPALLAGLLPQLIRRTIANTSPRSWLTMLSALTQKPYPQTSTPARDRAVQVRAPRQSGGL